MIDVPDIKSALRIQIDADDDLLAFYETSVVAIAEHECGRILEQRALSLTMEAFPEFIQPKAPLVSVESIAYLDQAGTQQTLAVENYDVTTGLQGRIDPAFGVGWPATQKGNRKSVTVNYTAGYTAANVPKSVSLAIIILVGHYYEHRVATDSVQLYEIPLGYRYLLSQIEKAVA